MRASWLQPNFAGYPFIKYLKPADFDAIDRLVSRSFCLVSMVLQCTLVSGLGLRIVDTFDCHIHCWYDLIFTLYEYKIVVCIVYTGMTFALKIEADSNDITEHPRDDKSRPYLCTVCDKCFKTKAILNEHKQMHTGGMLYSCTLCERRFTTQRYLRQHMNVHSSKHKCTECGNFYSSSRSLTVHRRTHSGEKPFECTVCSKAFRTSGECVRHSRIHSGEKPHICSTCDKAFVKSADLIKHIRVHMGEKPYKCSLCDKCFIQVTDLRRHKCRVHGNSRPYACYSCGKRFKCSSELKRHVYTHTDAKPYSCRHCSDCFTQLVQLKAHLLQSHNEGTWFTCHTCQKKFSRNDNLKRHLLLHEFVKPYVCSECPKRFFRESNMIRHQLKHSDYKHFCCGSCGKYFKHKESIIRHFNRCSVKLGDISVFMRQDWDREQTTCRLLLVAQSCYCWHVTCHWGSVYSRLCWLLQYSVSLAVGLQCLLCWCSASLTAITACSYVYFITSSMSLFVTQILEQMFWMKVRVM